MRVICLTATSISNQQAGLLLTNAINLAERNKEGQAETEKRATKRKQHKAEKPQYDKEREGEEERKTPRKKGRGEKLNS